MLIDWVRSGRTGKYLALGHGARTSLLSVRTPWPRAKYFPVWPSHSVNKYIILYIKNFKIAKQKKLMCNTQSGKNYAINCAIQGVRLIWKQKIWLTICKFLWSLTNQNAWFVSSFCTELTVTVCYSFLHCFKKNGLLLTNQNGENFLCILWVYDCIKNTWNSCILTVNWNNFCVNDPCRYEGYWMKSTGKRNKDLHWN